jgi:hypothetical protein
MSKILRNNKQKQKWISPRTLPETRLLSWPGWGSYLYVKTGRSRKTPEKGLEYELIRVASVNRNPSSKLGQKVWRKASSIKKAKHPAPEEVIRKFNRLDIQRKLRFWKKSNFISFTKTAFRNWIVLIKI